MIAAPNSAIADAVGPGALPRRDAATRVRHEAHGRSITGPYLALLGASATAVGIVSGLGELIGYALRLVSGHRTGRPWAFTVAGYL